MGGIGMMSSPDSLLSRIRFDPKPPADGDILDQLDQRDKLDRLRDALKGVDQKDELPLGGIKINDGQVTAEPRELIAPAIDPFPVADNLAVARGLMADCVELRKRIESLQQDIFNLSQDKIEFERETALRATGEARYTRGIALIEADLAVNAEEIVRAKAAVARLEALDKNFGPGNLNYTSDRRKVRRLRRELFGIVYGSTEDAYKARTGSESFRAQLFPDANVVQGARDDADKEIQADTAAAIAALANELDRARSNLASLEREQRGMREGLQLARDDLQLSQERWKTRKQLFEQRRAQAEDDAGVGLFRRLQEALALYGRLTGLMRTTLHAVEFGQSQIYGLAVPGFSVGDPYLRLRYLLDAKAGGGSPDPQAPPRRDWATLDQMVQLLIDAEARQRAGTSAQRVWQEAFELSGQFDANGRATVSWSLARPDVTLDPGTSETRPARHRVIGMRLINRGARVGIAGKLSPKRPAAQGSAGLAGQPDPGQAVHAIFVKHGYSFRIDRLEHSDGAVPVGPVSDLPKLVNRHANGSFDFTLTRLDAADAKFSVGVELLIASND